jgi:AbiV family abortive infection protein
MRQEPNVHHLRAAVRRCTESLSVLALEELAKPPLLWGIGLLGAQKDYKSFWRAFASHSPKQKTIGSYGQVMETIGLGPYDLRMTEEVVEALDCLKQWGFYVDCIGGSFQSPDMFAANEDEILDVVLAVADAGEVMPPKSTWFEPKLRDGLVVLLLGAPPGH